MQDISPRISSFIVTSLNMLISDVVNNSYNKLAIFWCGVTQCAMDQIHAIKIHAIIVWKMHINKLVHGIVIHFHDSNNWDIMV